MLEHLQPEEQSLFAHKVRVRAAAAIRLSLLRIRLEEIVQHTRSCKEEALRLQDRRDPRSASLTPPAEKYREILLSVESRDFFKCVYLKN